MSNEIVLPTLAERREALIAECSMQRTGLAHQVAALRPPSEGGLGMLGNMNLKVPLMIMPRGARHGGGQTIARDAFAGHRTVAVQAGQERLGDRASPQLDTN
ncbi:hypothetical protein LP420_12465 [Massilia sp. B-10]|nr:hypothetical protein LP420_12465 [Massilia sp. B-10]